jgi:hypothetical protein
MATRRMDALIDEGSEDSFPASDPPSYMAGTGVAGPPSHTEIMREPVFTELLSDEEGSQASDEVERQTHERAYFLWEQEGWPEGRADEHWYAAERESPNT